MSGELLMGRFRLLERIGAGGMGVVYRAFDERLQREVAVKEIVTEAPDRVLREAQAAARLNHPGIVTVYELGARDDRALLVGELVPGATLAQLIADNELSDRDVAELGADLADALVHAHAHGVVHRDLKPHNVVVRDDDGAGRRAKLMDFGIARVAGAPTLTASGEVVGTLAYMSPEQAAGDVAGPESDVYSLALTLYESWTGANPVLAESPAATARLIGEAVPSLGDRRPDLPAGLADTVDDCLRAEPTARPSPYELRTELEAAMPRLEGERRVPAPPESKAAGPATPVLSLVRLGALVAFAGCLALTAGPLGLPGLALVVAVLAGPAMVLLPGSLAAVAPAGALLGAVGVAEAYPAVAASVPARSWQRALAGALGAWWALAAALALGAGSRLGIAPRAGDGWESSAGEAAATVLAPLAEPTALAAAAAFAAASAALGWALSSRHASLAALGALLWAAGVSAVLRLIGNGALGETPLVVALAAAAALCVSYLWRSRGDGRMRAVRRGAPAPRLATGSP